MPIEKVTESLVCEITVFFYKLLDNTFSKTFPVQAISKYKNDFCESAIRDAVGDGQRIMLCARENTELAGILFGSSLNGGVASIVWLATAENYRGRGIGTLLCHAAETQYQLKGAHKIILYTETKSAKAFYQKIGYTLEGQHLRHWWGLDHYCLVKFLDR